MARNKENFNDKLGKWLAFGNELDTSKMRDLTKEEEENCSKALYKISEGTGINYTRINSQSIKRSLK